jgi:hypothetical protein
MNLACRCLFPCLLLWTMLYPNLSFGDTLDFKSHDSLNGRVWYQDSGFCITSRFPHNVTKSYRIPRQVVVKLKFTETDFNSEPPPDEIIGYAASAKNRQGTDASAAIGPNDTVCQPSSEESVFHPFSSAAPSDDIFMTDGSTKSGRLLLITDKVVKVSKGSAVEVLLRKNIKAIVINK